MKKIIIMYRIFYFFSLTSAYLPFSPLPVTHISGVFVLSPRSGPYERKEGEYFLHTDTDTYDAGENCTFVGPGHGSAVYVDESDSWWYVYHTWRYHQVGINPPGRVLAIDKMEWDEEGWPRIGTPTDYPTPAPHDQV